MVQAVWLEEFTSLGKKKRQRRNVKEKKLCNKYVVTSVLSLDRERGQISPLAAETVALIISFPAGTTEE